jgi:uncharacterized protein
MKIAIISDVHDHLRLFSKCIDYLNSINIDLLIHCGDWDMAFSMRPLAKANFPIKGVLGNGDPDIEKFFYQLQKLDVLKKVNLSLEMEMHDFVIDSKRVCVFHGDDPQVVNLVLQSQYYDLFCVGHTHIYDIKKQGKTLVVNPGSFVGYTYEKGVLPVYCVIYDTQSGDTVKIDLDTL